MPRKSKTQSPTTTAPGQPYGVAAEQQAAMKAVPLPNTAVIASQTAPTAPAVPTPLPTMQTGTDSKMSGPMMMADQMPGPSLLEAALRTTPPESNAFTDPSQYPKDVVPMTPVMNSPRSSATANILNMIAEAHGNDPALIAVAADAARKGY